ncbi:reverse transcriptase domain-containing protein [Tanacetum coccineum]
MRTRSSSNLIVESSMTLICRNRRRSKQRVELFSLEETSVVTMAGQRTMAELLQAPTEGYRDAIVILAILAKNFELKHGLLNLVTSKQFYGFKKEDPHAHIRLFNKITSTIKYKDVPNSSIKLMLFPFSIEGAARIWLEKEPPPPGSILTWEDLVSKHGTRFKDLLRACPHHSFMELHQLDTFYNALTSTDQDSLNAAASVSTNAPSSFTPHSPEIVALADAVKAMLHQKSSPPAFNLPLPELNPTQMILELADRSTTCPSGIAEDVFVKVGRFHFPADFVVVDYVVDPRVPLILRRPFLRMARALIDVYDEELTLRVDDEAITFKVGQTSRYSYNDVVSINRIDVIDVACEEYAQEVLEFLDSSTSGNLTPSLDPILSTSSPSLTPFEEGDFILEEIKACLTNDSIPPGIDDDDFDPEADLLLLEKLLNDDPLSPLPLKELNVEELKTVKSSIDDPPELELKVLLSHPEYAFLEGTDKLPVIIAKNLKEDEKVRLLKVLKSHKRAIAWKISDIKGIDP